MDVGVVRLVPAVHVAVCGERLPRCLFLVWTEVTVRVMADIGPVNLATGARWREVVGDGERVWERVMATRGEPPCHMGPREQWCDKDGPGGFMGHTCWPKLEVQRPKRVLPTIEEEIQAAADQVAAIQRSTRERCLAEFLALANHVEIDAGIGSDVEKVYWQCLIEHDRRRDKMRDDEKLKAEREDFNAKRQAAGLEPVNQERSVPRVHLSDVAHYPEPSNLEGALRGGTPYADRAGFGVATSRPTLADEHEKRAYDHRNEHERSARAAAFFRAHPEFDEFIRLIREGVISI